MSSRGRLQSKIPKLRTAPSSPRSDPATPTSNTPEPNKTVVSPLRRQLSFRYKAPTSPIPADSESTPGSISFPHRFMPQSQNEPDHISTLPTNESEALDKPSRKVIRAQGDALQQVSAEYPYSKDVTPENCDKKLLIGLDLESSDVLLQKHEVPDISVENLEKHDMPLQMEALEAFDTPFQNQESKSKTSLDPSCPTEKELTSVVDILYAPNPIRNDSIASVTTPESSKQDSNANPATEMASSTYLQLYRKKKESPYQIHDDSSYSSNSNPSSKTVGQIQNPDSLEWDYDSPPLLSRRREDCTQTSKHYPDQRTVGVGSFIVLECQSQESLLEDTKPPSAIITELTNSELELSDGDHNHHAAAPACPTEAEPGIEGLADFEEKDTNAETDDFLESDLITEDDTEVEPEIAFQEQGCITSTHGKKAKTIFSVELPVTKSKVVSGPGENGDGNIIEKESTQYSKDDLLASPSTNEVKNEKTAEIKEINFGCSQLSSVTASRVQSQVPFNLKAEYSSQQDMWGPSLHASPGGLLEIRPSPAPLSPEEMKWIKSVPSKPSLTSSKASSRNQKVHGAQSKVQTCEIVTPKSSSLILKRDSQNEMIYGGPIQILNSTSFHYGYKIFCNQRSVDYLRITPSIGLIHPHTEIQVDVKTQFINKLQASEGKVAIAVNTFRCFCEEPQKLKEYYKNLEDQHPELIRSQIIDRIVVWNSGDLPSMMNMLNTIADDKEREEMKRQIHLNDSKLFHGMDDDNHVSRSLVSVKEEMLVANQGLREVLYELANIRNTLHFSIFLAISIFGFTMILPYTMTKVEIPEPEMNWYENIYYNCISGKDYVKDKLSDLFDRSVESGWGLHYFF